jgi:serine/threonine protein kinase
MNILKLKVVNERKKEDEYYMPLRDGRPIRLGTGRNAVVFLGWTSPEGPDDAGNKNIAFKFIKDDQNKQYARMSEMRFQIEAVQTREFGQMQGYFVNYLGLGFIENPGDLESILPPNIKLDKLKNKSDNEEPYHNIVEHYKLQGPFYALELCQGTLDDVFESNAPWSQAVEVYQSIDKYKNALGKQSGNVFDDISMIKEKFFKPEVHNSNCSGYDILNGFVESEEANKIRNYAVLELFSKIIYTVSQLHQNDGYLAHRDLKLGNIFLSHHADVTGFDQITFKLADLGFVTSIKNLSPRDWTLEIDNWRTPGALVPGSQFYRAPEQSRLPLEVRVSIDNNESKRAIIKGSKITNLEKGDYLVIGDYFGGEGSPQEIKINDIKKASGNLFEITLEQPVDLEEKKDLQAHIIKSTGFHTDGFSLGAILYDLVSGGKDPEEFYIYCLARYQKSFDNSRDSSEKWYAHCLPVTYCLNYRQTN